MNRERRKKIQLVATELEILVNKISEIQDEEQESLDNMPENLQFSERAFAAEDAIDTLGEAIDTVNEAINALNGI
jgi:hypothetical protein